MFGVADVEIITGVSMIIFFICVKMTVKLFWSINFLYEKYSDSKTFEKFIILFFEIFLGIPIQNSSFNILSYQIWLAMGVHEEWGQVSN